MLLVLVLTFFAANLWGLFEIPLPRWLADTIETASELHTSDEGGAQAEDKKPAKPDEETGGAEAHNAYHPKLAADFATGAFATLLATPCTAPFLGTAVVSRSHRVMRIYRDFRRAGMRYGAALSHRRPVPRPCHYAA